MITDEMLENNKLPWCFLSEEMKEAFEKLKVSGEVHYLEFNGSWSNSTVQRWNGNDKSLVFRKKPEVKTKPVIPWDSVKEEFVWAARDENGEIWFYKEEPYVDSEMWVADTTDNVSGEVLSLDPGTCDWKESLVERPK